MQTSVFPPIPCRFSSFWKTRKRGLPQVIPRRFVYIIFLSGIFAVITNFSLNALDTGNPHGCLYQAAKEGRLPLTKRRKVGTTSNHHAPYVLGYTRNTMAVNRGMQNREVERTPKSRPSSDRGLQPAHVKSESLVIADQHAAVNTFPGLVHTARHTMRVGNTRSP